MTILITGASTGIGKALNSSKPKRSYVVGPDTKGEVKVSRLPKGLLDWIIF